MRKIIVVVVVLVIGTMFIFKVKEQEVTTISTFRNNKDLISAYVDGEDITTSYEIARKKAIENVQKYLDLTQEEIGQIVDCMMGDKYITLELFYHGDKYTFFCNYEGKLLGINREENYVLSEWEKNVYQQESAE